jgi:hypothetical protein
MLSGKELLQKLPIYNGNIGILKYDQSTDDIITNLLNVHNEYKKDYDKIYPYFLGNSLYDTCNNIFNFLKRNVLYKIEPSTKQTLKSPSAIIAQGYGDCKQYSQFAGGILDAISRNKKNINWCYRFSSYNDNKELQHVFIVAKDNSGKEIWIDPVLETFNKKKKYTYKVDKKPMALYKISGLGVVKEQINDDPSAGLISKAECFDTRPKPYYIKKYDPNKFKDNSFEINLIGPTNNKPEFYKYNEPAGNMPTYYKQPAGTSSGTVNTQNVQIDAKGWFDFIVDLFTPAKKVLYYPKGWDAPNPCEGKNVFLPETSLPINTSTGTNTPADTNTTAATNTTAIIDKMSTSNTPAETSTTSTKITKYILPIGLLLLLLYKKNK